MLGLLAGAVLEIARGISGIGCAIENAKSKQRGREREANGQNPSHTYYDRKGVERDLITGAIRRTTRTTTGDKVLTDKYGKVVRNFSQEEREHNLRETQANRKAWYVTAVDWGAVSCFDECRGRRYKDIKNNRIYVCRKIGGYSFFMDVKTGEYVRPTDWQYQKWETGNTRLYGSIEDAREVLKKHLETRTNFYDNVYDCGLALADMPKEKINTNTNINF